jgi:hypothetical protein
MREDYGDAYPSKVPTYSAACVDCGCEGSYGTRPEAVAAWNKRHAIHALDAGDGVRERVEKACDDLLEDADEARGEATKLSAQGDKAAASRALMRATTYENAEARVRAALAGTVTP